MNETTRENRFCRAVLFGEAPDADLSERDRAAAETVRALFRRDLAAPPFDRAKLLKALRTRADAAPGSPAPFSIMERPRARVWRIATVAALLALAVGVAWVLMHSPAATNLHVNPGGRRDAQRLPDGRWRCGDVATLKPLGSAQVATNSDGVMVLREGRAELTCDGKAGERVEVLKTLDGVRVAVQGPSRTGLRVREGGRWLGISVYEGARESVTLTPDQKPLQFSVGQNMDAEVFATSSKFEMRITIWPDVTAKLPPVNGGDIYLRLVNGSVVRGRLVWSTGEALRMLGTRAPVTGGAETRPDVPESILARELVAWTPAETPRGRDTYARWFDECASAQLLDARRAWLVYLTEADAGLEHERQPAEFLASQRPLPETTLRVSRRGDEPVLRLIPQDAELGPGWEMNMRGEVSRIVPDAPVKGQEF